MVEQANRNRITAVQLECNYGLNEMLAILDEPRNEPVLYFYDPDEGAHSLAIGALVSLKSQGTQRFQDIARQLSGLSKRVFCQSGCRPRLFGGFSFSTERSQDENHWKNWPDGLLVLPNILLQHSLDTGRTIAIVCSVEESDDAFRTAQDAVQTVFESAIRDEEATAGQTHPEMNPVVSEERQRQRWLEQVRLAADEIQKGMLEKVVLARLTSVGQVHPVSETIQRLQENYPNNFTFAFWYDHSCFVGSSPERLASLDKRELKVDCLAGSERRGRTIAEDEQLAAGLLASSKNRREHEAVVKWVKDRIAPFVREMPTELSPQIKKLSNVQHLYTPVRTNLNDGVAFFDVLETLHPTPAVAGVPRADAIHFIHRVEQIERGWYAGPIGWVDLHGEGTFAVALRSGLVTAEETILYAGAGIMGDSIPESEWDETELKLVPMRDALGCQSEGR